MQQALVEASYQSEGRLQKYYSWRSSNYDAGTRFEAEHHAAALRLAAVLKGQSVLDVACGTGRATVGLAQAVGATGRVDALDLSEAMMAQCRVKIEKLGLGGRVHFKQGNARQLPFPDETFDIAYNGYMFDLIPLDGFLPILKEMARVLKPGGELMLVNMSKRDARRTFFDTLYEKGFPVGPCRPVLMRPYLELAGFADCERIYRPNRVGVIPLPFGTEIIRARKPVPAGKDL